MSDSRVDGVINSICKKGCRYVNTILSDEKAQQSCRELLQLNTSDQNIVIDELKSVMSVYDQTGSCGA
ncbi:MAG: hypothetical protein HOC92_20725 [Gammaproteobacteria bacterium]|nr:hypothetical protein [Gammaproteobacteria bacterium]